MKYRLVYQIIYIMLLLAISIFFWHNKSRILNIINDRSSVELRELRLAHQELYEDNQKVLDSLHQLRNESKELNALIESQKEYISSERNRVSDLIWAERAFEKINIKIRNLSSIEINKINLRTTKALDQRKELYSHIQCLENLLDNYRNKKRCVSCSFFREPNSFSIRGNYEIKNDKVLVTTAEITIDLNISPDLKSIIPILRSYVKSKNIEASLPIINPEGTDIIVLHLKNELKDILNKYSRNKNKASAKLHDCFTNDFFNEFEFIPDDM